MAEWTDAELASIGNAEELQIAPMRQDGSLRKPVIIWVVRVDDELYVRSYKGADAHWFRGVLVRHEGRIEAGGVSRDVAFEQTAEPAVNDAIDAAYRTKYQRYGASLVNSMAAPSVRSTTIRLVPR